MLQDFVNILFFIKFNSLVEISMNSQICIFFNGVIIPVGPNKVRPDCFLVNYPRGGLWCFVDGMWVSHGIFGHKNC